MMVDGDGDGGDDDDDDGGDDDDHDDHDDDDDDDYYYCYYYFDFFPNPPKHDGPHTSRGESPLTNHDSGQTITTLHRPRCNLL